MSPCFSESNSFLQHEPEAYFDVLSEKFEYIGWIPNTTGHVYFRNATLKKQRGTDGYLARSPYLKEGPGEIRYILATSLENLNDDVPVPEQGDAIFTRFIVSARSVNKKILYGDLWMIWDNGKIPDPTKSYFERTIVTLFKSLEESVNTLKKYGAKLGKAIDSETFKAGDYKAAFELFKQAKKDLGDLICNLGSGEQLKLDSNFWVSRFEFAVTNRGFCYLRPHESNIDKGNIETEINQAYYHLKYLLHTHQHHDDKLDALSRLHKTESCSALDLNTAVDLLRDIKSSLINIKLNQPGVEYAMYSIKGIASYAISLIQQLKAEKILKIENQEHMDFVERETKYMDSLVKSTEVLQQDTTTSGPIRAISKINAVFIFLTILLGPLILLGIEIAKLKINPSEDKRNICERINELELKGADLFLVNTICEHGGVVAIAVPHILLWSIAFLLIYGLRYMLEDRKGNFFLAGFFYSSGKPPKPLPLPLRILTQSLTDKITQPLTEYSWLRYTISKFLIKIDLIKDNARKYLVVFAESHPIAYLLVPAGLVILVFFSGSWMLFNIANYFLTSWGKWSLIGCFDYLGSELGSLLFNIFG